MLARTSTVSALARQSVARTFFNSANVAGQIAVDEEFPGVPASHAAAPKHGKTDVSVTAAGIKVGSDNSEPLVATLGVQLAAGSRVETDETAGLSQLFTKMAFRATDARSDLRLFRDIEAIGGVVHKEAGRDFVRYAVSVLPHHADAAAQILAETTLAPRFAQWDIDAQKKQVLAELDVLAANPATVVLEGLHAAAFYDDATLGRPIVTKDNLAGYTSADLWAFYDQYVNTTSAAVIGTGIEHSELTSLANEHFSGLGLSTGSPAARTPAKYVGGESRVKTTAAATHVALGFETVGKLDPLYGSVHVLRAILSGRVNPKHASAFFASYGEVGVVGLAGHAANADVGALVESFAAEIKSLATTPVSADELAVAKTVAALDAYTTMATRNGMLSRVGLLALHQVPAPSPLELANSATPDSIQALAKKALAARPSLASIGKVSAVPRVDALAAKLQ